MASDMSAVRTFSRLRRFWGVRSSNDLEDTDHPTTSMVHHGMFAEGELRHIGTVGESTNPNVRRLTTEEGISTFLRDIAGNTRKKIDEIRNLKLMAPEINQAKTIIVSSLLSPQDLQCDKVTVQVDNPNLGSVCNSEITDYITEYFNDTFHLATKLYQWYSNAGFTEGASAVLVLPKQEINVLNTVADKWVPEDVEKFKQFKKQMAAQEALYDEHKIPDLERQRLLASVESLVEAEVIEMKAAKDCWSEGDWKKHLEKHPEFKDLQDSGAVAKKLVSDSFKLLSKTDKGEGGVVVTKDVDELAKHHRKTVSRVAELEKAAAAQIHGYRPNGKNMYDRPQYPVLCMSDIIKADEKDLPIIIELPSDSVIPVCAPNDKRNPLGYFVMMDENGLPIRGQYAFGGGINQDITNRLAANAAKAFFGNAQYNAMTISSVANTAAIDQMTQIFSIAVNHLLESKLSKDGLTGLDVQVHSAVGKALFFNLLAKNRIKMIFVPASMMVYYCFDHRDDGTGKTLLEDISFILALRCTLTIAKIMAAIENATMQRRIEVNVDEKELNPEEVLNLVRHQYIAKKAPSFTTDPCSAAEAILNSHISIVPKGLVGTTDDLSVTTEKSYGSAQAPDENLAELLNNWTALGLGVPPAALNQLAENEYSRSIATQNLLFANRLRGWQGILDPENTKLVINVTLCDGQMKNRIREIIKKHTKPTGKKEADKNKAASPGDLTAPEKDETGTLEKDLLDTIASMRVVLPPPNVSTSKAHFEEVQSYTDAVQKMLETIYPDDIAPNDDLKPMMATLRAQVASNLLREFLPKLGFHQIASVPNPDELDGDYSSKILLYLNNSKRRYENLIKMASGQMGTGSEGGGEPGDMGEAGEGDTGGDGGESGGGEDTATGAGSDIDFNWK